MATANELFAANGEDYIVIDSDLRTMTFPASVNNIGVENDKDVHKLNFKMPRYFSGYDLSEFIIHINYVNANGDADMYYVLDPTIEENEIIFSWLVGRHACLYRGSVTFIVCLKLADGEGDVAQEFNTTLASLQVLPGLETEPTILETEHDVIEQLLLSINDTNAKIKAVLDTGLTPEQIAEFYNKSKTYDTQIATLNSRLVTMPMPIINGLTTEELIGAAYNDAHTSSPDQTWYRRLMNHGVAHSVLGGGRYYLEGYRESANYGWQRATSYSTSQDALPCKCYERSIVNGTWSDWLKIPTRHEFDALNSSKMPSLVANNDPTVDANTLDPGLVYAGNGSTNVPDIYVFIWTYRIGKYWAQFARSMTGQKVWIRYSDGTNTPSGEWEQLPTRAEVDALNRRLNNNGEWNELLGGKSQNGDYTLNDSYEGYKSVVVMLFGSGSTIASCIYPTKMLITAGYHPVVEAGSNKVDIVFTSSTNVKVSDLNGSVRIYGIR